MKYKNINAAIHNFGHGFTSLTNYDDPVYLIDQLHAIHQSGEDIEIDWLSRRFSPAGSVTPEIERSINRWADDLSRHLESHQIDPACIARLCFIWPAGQRKTMEAVDDRGKVYRIHVNEVR